MKRTFEEILESYNVQLGDNRRDESIVIAAEQYANQSKWISVEDSLPEYGMRVLCYCQEQNSLGLSHFVWNCAYNETNKSFKDAGIDYSVTHWQPLPNPPTK